MLRRIILLLAIPLTILGPVAFALGETSFLTTLLVVDIILSSGLILFKVKDLYRCIIFELFCMLYILIALLVSQFVINNGGAENNLLYPSITSLQGIALTFFMTI